MSPWDTQRQTKKLELHWALGTHYSELFRAISCQSQVDRCWFAGTEMKIFSRTLVSSGFGRCYVLDDAIELPNDLFSFSLMKKEDPPFPMREEAKEMMR